MRWLSSMKQQKKVLFCLILKKHITQSSSNFSIFEKSIDNSVACLISFLNIGLRVFEGIFFVNFIIKRKHLLSRLTVCLQTSSTHSKTKMSSVFLAIMAPSCLVCLSHVSYSREKLTTEFAVDFQVSFKGRKSILFWH